MVHINLSESLRATLIPPSGQLVAKGHNMENMSLVLPDGSFIQTDVFDDTEYFNLTHTAQRTGVRLDNYWANEATEKFLTALSNSPLFGGIKNRITKTDRYGGRYVGNRTGGRGFCALCFHRLSHRRAPIGRQR